MDGLSAVAGVAAAGVQLSKTLYDLCTTVKTSRREIEDVANNVALLAMVLEELDGVLCDDELNYRPQLRKAAQSIVLRCAGIFKDIRKHTGEGQDLKGKRFSEKLAWYFKRERVKPLRSSLESLKSTLNILLNVVQLAKRTKGVEEYPGVKPIGQWYVRKERRGLVCLVIENRHAVEKLKRLEDQKVQTDLDSIENEQPLRFADVFPLSTSNNKRDESPERKFVVVFGNHKRRSDDGSRRTQEPDIDLLQAGPKTPDSDRFLLPVSSREDRSQIDHSVDSDAESIGRSINSGSTRKSRARHRSARHQAVSRLILNVIPHEDADERFKSAQNMSNSTLLEAKAEDTIDTLMRHWTYVDPKYFSDDDRSSISSTEPSLPSIQKKDSPHSHRQGSLGRDKRFSSSHGVSSKQRPELREENGPTNELDDVRTTVLQADFETSSPLPAGRKRTSKRRPSPLLPTLEDDQGVREFKHRSLPHTPNDPELHNSKEPSTPAPPYLSSSISQCSSCHAAIASRISSCADERPCQPNGLRVGDTKTDNPTKSSIDNMMRLFETKILELIKQPSLQDGVLDTLSRQMTEPQADRPPSATIEQEFEPVILKDYLGRRFLFPIQKCRSWQSMEHLIQRSFSHDESINSKIFRGSYDILSPTGEIILPEIWDTVIKPGWVVELRLWDLVSAGGISQVDPNVGAIEMAPAVQSSSIALRESAITPSSDVVSSTAKRRASLRTWLGSRKLTPSVSLE